MTIQFEDKKTILIVEDSPTQALKLQMALEDKNFDVLHGLSAEEALELLDIDNPPSIIITDIVMPGMDGYELCQKIKDNQDTREIPVILLTQLSDPKDVIKGLQCGADNFISKPYTNDFLFERISDILLNKQIRKRSPNLDISMQIYFGGEKYNLNSNRMQILDLLLSTYYNAINKNKELEEKNIELKKLQKETNIKNVQLKKLNKEKNQFLGIAAHDLRSPLATLSGFLSIIVDSLPEDSIEDQDQIFSAMEKMLDYMLNLINDVLDFSKIEAGILELDKTKTDLVSFLDKIIEYSNILGSKKSIHVKPKYSKEKALVSVDTNKLTQVMDNLLSNAIKYSLRDKSVFIDIVEHENQFEVIVEDEGKGIPENEINKIFKPFTRTSVESTDGEKSTGLGLATVKKIIDTHNGEIWADSKVGIGTKFHFTLPKKAN